jgi:hypothetical protein
MVQRTLDARGYPPAQNLEQDLRSQP